MRLLWTISLTRRFTARGSFHSLALRQDTVCLVIATQVQLFYPAGHALSSAHRNAHLGGTTEDTNSSTALWGFEWAKVLLKSAFCRYTLLSSGLNSRSRGSYNLSRSTLYPLSDTSWVQGKLTNVYNSVPHIHWQPRVKCKTVERTVSGAQLSFHLTLVDGLQLQSLKESFTQARLPRC